MAALVVHPPPEPRVGGEALRRELALLDEELGLTTVRAPAAGLVLTPRMEERTGTSLAEGDRLLVLGRTDTLELEFGVPQGAARPLWELYVRAVLPLAGTALRNGWQEVGRFLGGSIRGFWAEYPLERQLELWRAAGLRGTEVRRLSLGGGYVVWGRRA